jgi:hypothetical protein
MALKLDLKDRAPLEEEARKLFKQAFDTALLELADYLQKNSPRGVSDAGDSLAGGWDVIPARKVRGILPEAGGSVVNNADAAEFRIRGRGPGKPPPISKIEKWAIAAGISPYALAKSIAKNGTERWRSRDNILKQDPITLEFKKDSPLYTVFEKRLREEWDKINI